MMEERARQKLAANLMTAVVELRCGRCGGTIVPGAEFWSEMVERLRIGGLILWVWVGSMWGLRWRMSAWSALSGRMAGAVWNAPRDTFWFHARWIVVQKLGWVGLCETLSMQIILREIANAGAGDSEFKDI